MTGFKRSLEKIDRLIKEYEDLVQMFPESNLREALCELRQKRVDIVSRIGKNHEHQ